MTPTTPARRAFLPILALLIAALTGAGGATAATLELADTLLPGKAVFLTVKDAPPGTTFQGGALQGVPFPLSDDGRALVALDMEAKPGAYLLRVRMRTPEGKPASITRTIRVGPRKYQEERLNLPETKVTPNPKDMARAEKETAKLLATYTLRDGEPGYLEGFRMPVPGRISGVFGSRRILNGKPRNPHNGLDLAAGKGTPVTAIAPGVVAMTGKDFFFTGNTLVLHHGDGVVSLYAHLDTMTVKEGERVTKGQEIGRVGMTGRATGPHLHFGTLVRGARVDPSLMPGVASPGGD
ncbi:MAG: M23 family metallopeptidase [Magnetococcales bacterium]|nr:M23 family metallopeptidase [Magnetococcales bacterium]